jgi:hypothetical protein
MVLPAVHLTPDEFAESQRVTLTPRWYPLRHHPEHARLWTSEARFRVVPAGRRSGKTELAKRYLVLKALTFHAAPDGRFYAFAPTNDQAREIFWEDLKALVPQWARARADSEGRMTIWLLNGARIRVVGLDRPQRIEGGAIDGAIFDEMADMREEVWTKHLRPMFSTIGREGWAWFIGVPGGRGHYYQLYRSACRDETGEWDGFHWRSADILSPKEIAAAQRDLDELSYAQEYEASFVNFEGRAYYTFEEGVHAGVRVSRWYDPAQPLILALDFNRSPGVAAIGQELPVFHPSTGRRRTRRREIADEVTCWIGEVWIPRNSDTTKVCRRFLGDWGEHEGEVHLYGDASGGARTTQAVDGSDWDLVDAELRPTFGRRLRDYVEKSNPPVRSRVNAMNTRFRSADGTVRQLVDPVACPHLVDDCNGVVVLEGGSGEIDKDHDKWLTHISDGAGYYVASEHPLGAVVPVASNAFRSTAPTR